MADKTLLGTETRDVPALSQRAAVGSANAEKRTVEVVWTTGAKVLRSSYYDGAFYEELSLDPAHVRMGRLNNGAPFLANHDGYDVSRTLGVVVSARLESGQGVATIRFAKAEDDPEADKVFRKIQDGIIQNVSVGYRIYKVEKVEAVDEKVPTLRVIDWEPSEISAVAMGADDGAGFRAADNSHHKTNVCTFITRGLAPQESRKMTPEEIAAEKAKQDAQRTADVEQAVKAERERVSGINSAVRSLGTDGAQLAASLIKDGVKLDDARAQVLDALNARSESTPVDGHVRVEITDDKRDKFVRGMSAWMFEKSGNGLVELAQKRGVKGFENVEIDGAEFRGMSLMDIARLCAERNGHNTRGVYNRERLINLALTVRGGYGSTSDFGVLFENVMYKSMRAAYATQQDTWRRFCGTDTVSDFRSANRFLNGSFGTLPVVAEGGEFKNLAIPDGAKQAISVQTYGAIISLSRQAMINDDMGAFLDVAVRFGASSGRTIESAVYALLAQNSGLGPTCDDSVVFFNASHNNVTTGAALTAAALEIDRLKMRAQQDISSNDYLDLVPSILLIAPGLETAAKILNTDAYDPAQTGQKSNSARGLFTDIVTSQRLTAISTTRRWMFTAAKEAFKVVFLEGSGEGPTMETQDGFRVDGTEWKARIDFKAQAFDPKTALSNAGV